MNDVGKLNRLVIPKQYAEKHFPLDASSNEKGLLLSFEDSAGKPWRFCYSYWNSSQSDSGKQWRPPRLLTRATSFTFRPRPRPSSSIPCPCRRSTIFPRPLPSG